MIGLCQRQLACGVSHAVVVKMLLDFLDVLSPLLGLRGHSWSILGVLGFSSKYTPPPRAKFLALAISYFTQKCLLEGPQIKTKSESEDEIKCLNSNQVSQVEKELENMLTKQAFFGLTDNIEWVLKVTRDKTSSFDDFERFFSYIICDNLYTEKYHHVV